MADMFRIRVQKDSFVFSAGHFITFGNNICERIHGHNYRVFIEMQGDLDHNQCVFDFIQLREFGQQITARLDHRMLLPEFHPHITVTVDDEEIVARFDQRRWVFPRAECVVLPVANTTTEMLAKFIADELFKLMDTDGCGRPAQLTVGVDENNGQWAIYEWTPE